MDFLDDVAQQQRATWDALQISYTDFIRTTHPDHKHHVQSMLQKSYDVGDIYQDEYDGLYCV
jgi:methionyl-tRNA synthetase